MWPRSTRINFGPVFARSSVVLALVAVMAAACAEATASRTAVPPLDRVRAEQVALRADELVREAMAGSSAPLASVFRDQALGTLSAQAERLASRRMHVEERAVTRRLVHFDGFSLEVVLAVTAQTRFVTPDATAPAWEQTARQWWLRLAYSSARWWVVEERDLAPEQWFVAR